MIIEIYEQYWAEMREKKKINVIRFYTGLNSFRSTKWPKREGRKKKYISKQTQWIHQNILRKKKRNQEFYTQRTRAQLKMRSNGKLINKISSRIFFFHSLEFHLLNSLLSLLLALLLKWSVYKLTNWPIHQLCVSNVVMLFWYTDTVSPSLINANSILHTSIWKIQHQQQQQHQHRALFKRYGQLQSVNEFTRNFHLKITIN